jgi:F-type H+-transporting ATPase subunit b
MLNAFVAKAAEETPSLLLPQLPDLIWGSLAFLIVLVVVIWKVVPRLNAALDARADAIEGGLKRAEEAQAGAQEALEQYNAQLAEARTEAARIREDAKTQGTQILAELREQAQAEATRIRTQAEAQLEAERAQVVASLRSEIGGLATTLASRIVGESLEDDERARRTVDRFIADLEGQSTEAPAGQS